MPVSGQEISFIVEKLNQYLHTKFTLVAFDELSHKPALLQLLQDVLSALSNEPSTPIDLSKENIEATITRIKDFLIRILGLRFLREIEPNKLNNGLINGDPDVIYPTLSEILQKFQELKTRVYLAHFLIEIKVPDELMTFADVSELHAQYKQLIGDFKLQHQQTSGLRQNFASPATIKTEILSKEKEKENLKEKIEEQKNRLKHSHQDSEKLIKIAGELRIEKEEEKRQRESKEQQERLLEASRKKLEDMKDKILELESEASVADLDTLLNKIDKEVKQLRQRAQEDIPQLVKQQKTKNALIMKVLDGSKSMNTLQSEIEREIRSLKEEYNQLSEKIQNISNEPKKEENNKIVVFKRQAAIYINKKKELNIKLQSTKKEHEQLRKKLREMEQEIQVYSGQIVPTEEECEKLKREILEKAAVCKKMKAELAEVRGEVTVLKRTLEILKTKDANIQQFLDTLEAQSGVVGFRKVKEDLENIAVQKNEIDEMKGKTLQEISKIIQAIVEKINGKKEQLAPLVQQLKDARQEFQELESVHSEKKVAYEAIKITYDSEKSRLLRDIESLEDEINQSQNLYHMLTAQISICETDLKRAELEIEYKSKSSKRYSEQHQSYQDYLNSSIQKLEALSKDLREKQRDIKENYEPNLRQQKLFADLRKLMEHKLHGFKNPQQFQYNHINEIDIQSFKF